MMAASDGWDDLLFLLMVLAGGACLVCTYSTILLTVYRAPAEKLSACLAIFAVAAVALALTAGVSDLRAQRRARHHL